MKDDLEAIDCFRGRRGVLMDLDGTLYSNSSYVEEVDRITGMLVLDHYDTRDPHQAFSRLEADQRAHGFGSKTDALDRLFGISLHDQNRWRERWTRPSDFLEPDARITETLVQLAGEFTLLLGTNNAPALTRSVLAALEIPEDLFVLVLTSEDLGAAKPDRRFFLGVARESGIEPEGLVSVGDRQRSDLDPAARLGMGTYLVQTPEDVYRLENVRAGT